MDIKIIGIKELSEKLKGMEKTIQLATNRAIKDTAFEARTEVQAEMRKVFDRPTPWAIDTVRVDASKKEGMDRSRRNDVVIGLTSTRNNTASKWKSPEFAKPQVEGGERGIKRIERILRSAGILPSGMSVAPAKEAWLDQYGNLNGQEINQIIRSVGGWGDRSQIMGFKKGHLRTAKQNRYFVQYKQGRPYGIFEVLGKGNIRAVIIFIKKPYYKRLLNFYQVVQNTFLARFNKNFKQRFREYQKYPID